MSNMAGVRSEAGIPARAGRQIVRLANALSDGQAILGSIAVFVVMIAVTADILARALASRPIAGVFEVSQMLMVVIVFFSFAICEVRGQHIRVDSLTMHLSKGIQPYFDVLAYLVGIFLFVMIGYGAYQAAVMSMNSGGYTGGTVSIPLYPSKFAVAIGSLLVVIQFTISLIRTLHGIADKRRVAL